jgi:arylsulfatase A-like enzyme
MDRDIGNILDKLQELGIDENTVVMFSSDNGPHAEGTHDPDFFNDNGPLRGMKRDLYEGGIRVPMIIRWPGQIAPGSESDHPSAFWDILPTCAELAGAGSPGNIDGISFVPELLGRNQPEHEYLYWEFPAQGGKQAVRMGNWKGIRLNIRDQGREAPIELYNLSEGIGEENNVAEDNPDVVEQIAGIMERAHTPSENFPLFPEEIT